MSAVHETEIVARLEVRPEQELTYHLKLYSAMLFAAEMLLRTLAEMMLRSTRTSRAAE